jgi:hypothetical protein
LDLEATKLNIRFKSATLSLSRYTPRFFDRQAIDAERSAILSSDAARPQPALAESIHFMALRRGRELASFAKDERARSAKSSS